VEAAPERFAQGALFQPAAGPGQLTQFVHADAGDDEAALIALLHQTFGGQPVQRFADRRLTGLILLHEKPHWNNAASLPLDPHAAVFFQRSKRI
jgi:hypothetical protein